MRLGFDLDGTVADLQGALAREARTLFPDIDPGTLPSSGADAEDGAAESAPGGTGTPARASTSSLSQRQQHQLWAVVRSRINFWETLDEIESGALARLSQLARDRKWEVIFLTSRPETEGDTAQLQSHRWLAAQGFVSPSVFVVSQARGKIAAALKLDIVVDDRPENCLDVAVDSPARPILVWRGEQGPVPASARQLGIGVVSSIRDCLEILEQTAGAERGEVGMVERLRGLLGLKRRGSPPAQPAPQPATSLRG